MDKQIVRLIFPPQFEPFQPYLSPAYIKGLLNIFKIKSTCFDANIDFYWWLFKHWNKSSIADSNRSSYLLSNVDNALKLIHGITQDIDQYKWAINVINEYLSLINPHGVKINLTSLTIGNKYSSQTLHEYIDDPNNIFGLYFDFACNQIIGSKGIRYYFISVVVLDQLGAALTFAREIKRLRPGAKVIVGGPVISRLNNRILNMPWFNKSIDMFVQGEASDAMSHVFGLEERWDGHVSPDFGDYDMKKYLSPKLVLPYLVAHGCKWGLCTFCSHHITYTKYRASAIDHVVEDIAELTRQFNAEYISFSDEYLTSEQLDELITKLAEKKINIRWSTFVRAEPAFTSKTFMKKLYEGGARLLMFGFESASQRILNVMRKGNATTTYAPILDACKKANIAVRLDFIVGFPTESEEEAGETLSFIKDNSGLIDTPFSSYAVGAFELREGAPIMQETKRFGFHIIEPLRGDLDDQYQFTTTREPSVEQKKEWRHEMIMYLKNNLSAELITPHNKTHQLCFKDLFDQGYLTIPVTKMDAARFQQLHIAWTNGVTIDYSNSSHISIENYSTGGALKFSPQLFDFAKGIEAERSLMELFLKYLGWSLAQFIKIVEFLYRNDYVMIRQGDKGE